MDIFEEIVHLREQGRRAALATIINVQGSIPSFESAKMLVRDDGSILGTIGGGCIEAEVWQAAREVMEDEKPRTLNFNLNQNPGSDTGLVCGGSLSLYIEPLVPKSLLYVFGAGHVGYNVYRAARIAGFDVVVIDDREEFANTERFPEASAIYAEEYSSVFKQITPRDTSFIVIATRGHQGDMEILQWAVETEARYIGMLGSRRKVVTIGRKLSEGGTSPERLERVHAPIGLDIGATTPEEIAISIVAELIAVRRNSESALPHMRYLKKPASETTKEVEAVTES